MMFDTLVCPLSSDLEDEEERKDSFEIFKGSTKSLCEEVLQTKTSLKEYDYEWNAPESKDPILKYLQKYYTNSHPPTDHLDSSVEFGDLSWDEGDMPRLCLKIWTFNDFMEHYNNIYAWLNNIQVQYHADKKKEGASPRVESLLRDLEKDVEKRERFLRECGRMVGAYPELEEEVRWRLDHVMTKWEMLTQLRTKSKNNLNNVQDIYSDIEIEVRCLRRWLREMEARIDPLQFSSIASWSTRDRERKMAEYQVLQTDIESHGRIVKLVLGLCEDLSHNPGQYDVQHAVKVAKNLERRWHQIWLRSLEWQCLLEQWLTSPGVHDDTNVVDTDEEPLAKVAKFNTDCDTPLVSPAVTLLRKKKRKRLINVPNDEAQDPEKRIKLKSPRTPRNLPDSDLDNPEDEIIVTSMIMSESDPSTESAPSTSRSDSSDSVTFIFRNYKQEFDPVNNINETDIYSNDNNNLQMTFSEWNNGNQNNFNQRTSTPVFEENDFIANTVKRKTTVIMNPLDENEVVENNIEVLREDIALNMFSPDSLEDDTDELDEQYQSDRHYLELLSDSCSYSSKTSSSVKQYHSQESLLNCPVDNVGKGSGSNMELLHFGEDYRLFINSLSDTSVTNESKFRSKKLRRKNKRRESKDQHPYESQSEAEFDDIYHVVSKSQRQIHGVEERVTEYLALGFNSNLTEYDDILSKCSENVNILHNFLETIDTTQSFVARKKCRETRLLISRWENLLQKLLENVNNSKVFEKLKDESKHLRDVTTSLEESIQAAVTDVDLQTQIRKLQGVMDQLTGQKAKMDQLIINVHNFLAELGTSSFVDDNHLQLAEQLKNDITYLYAHWDGCSSRARDSLVKTEEAVVKLHEIERELIEFRKSLRTKQMHLMQGTPRRSVSKLKGSGSISSHDSGISDGSVMSDVFSDVALPEALEHLSRLQKMTKNLELTLSPHDPTIMALSRILNDTSLELDDIQKIYMKRKMKINLRRRGNSKKLQMKATKPDRIRPNTGRLGKFARVTLTIQALIMSLMFVTWLCQPQCCDNISAISFSSPSFKYVNGPPPI